MLPKFGKGQGSRRACHTQMLPLRTFLDALQLLVVKYVVNLIFKASTKTSLKAANLGLTSDRDDSRSLEDMSLEDVEAFLIKKALARNDGNARKAAEALGLSRSAFYRRLQHYDLL